MIAAFLAMPRQLKGFVIAGLAVLALCIAAPVWLWLHDRGVVKADRAKTEAVVTKTVLEAERVADRNDTERRVVRETHDRALHTVITEAVHDYPDETGRVAGPATRAVLAELRRQQPGQ